MNHSTALEHLFVFCAKDRQILVRDKLSVNCSCMVCIWFENPVHIYKRLVRKPDTTSLVRKYVPAFIENILEKTS